MSESTPATPTGLGSFLNGYLESPFSGIVPWVVLSVLSTPGRFEQAVCFALGLTLMTMWVGSRRGIPVYALDVFGAAFFVALGVLGLLASPGMIRFLETWAGDLSNIVLALFVVTTILLRKPFTLPYAKETTPEEFWGTQLFLHINYAISWIWVGVFAFSAAVGLFGDAVLHDANNFWTGWVLPIAAIFFAAAFSEFYPAYAGAREAATRGEVEESPSVVKLAEWAPMFVVVVGIFGWLTHALPDATGIGIIGIGVIGSVLISKFATLDRK
jgi:hypothetical protein